MGLDVWNELFVTRRLARSVLMDAMERCLNLAEQPGTLAIIVDPIDNMAAGFYKKHGFIELQSNKTMFLPVETIKQLWKKQN